MSKKENLSIQSIIEEINQLELSDDELNTSIENLKLSEEDFSKSISKINFLRANLITQNARKKSELLTRAYSKLMEIKEQHVGNAKEKLLSMLGSNNTQLQLHFSKLTNIDDKEALDMMEDALLLELIEKLSNDD